MAFLQFDPQQESLDKQVFRTYQNLRVGLCVIGILVPFMVWMSDLIQLNETGTRNSISAYYHSPHSLTRDLLVGNLFVVGIFLVLYRGYSIKENLVLNVGGVLLTGVALFPTVPLNPPRVADRSFIESIAYYELSVGSLTVTVHYLCAVGFFVAIGYVAVALSAETLEESTKPNTQHFRNIYRWLGRAMIIGPICVYIYVQLIAGEDTGLFWLETVGIIVFSLYWAVKTWEFWGTAGAVESKILGRKSGPA